MREDLKKELADRLDVIFSKDIRDDLVSYYKKRSAICLCLGLVALCVVGTALYLSPDLVMRAVWSLTLIFAIPFTVMEAIELWAWSFHGDERVIDYVFDDIFRR